jgi:hypothetical protein
MMISSKKNRQFIVAWLMPIFQFKEKSTVYCGLVDADTGLCPDCDRTSGPRQVAFAGCSASQPHSRYRNPIKWPGNAKQRRYLITRNDGSAIRRATAYIDAL